MSICVNLLYRFTTYETNRFLPYLNTQRFYVNFYSCSTLFLLEQEYGIDVLNEDNSGCNICIAPPGNPATRIVTSEGLELNGLNFPFNRVVTGGTGSFENTSGQVVQTGIGANSTGLLNFTFDYDLA